VPSPDPVPARADEIDAICALLESAARWLGERGVSQWAPGSLPRGLVVAGVARGEVFVTRGPDGALAATLQLQDSDPDVWGPDDGAALVLHRLCVGRAHAGEGLGLRLLDWACAQVRARGRRLLRLDCVASNAALCAYYARAGFEQRGEVELHGVRLRRFERVA
jgi:GNAT superfamily N-acetyltransferase